MADLFDRRRIFLIGLVVFTGASLASGLADSATALIALPRRPGCRRRAAHPGRAVGRDDHVRRPPARHRPRRVGHRRQHGHRRRRALRRPAHQRPRLARGLLHQRADRRRRAARHPAHASPPGAAPGPACAGLDLPGAVTLVGGLVALVDAVESHEQPRLGLDARTLVCAAVAAVLLTAFAVVERRVAAAAGAAAHLAGPLAGLGLDRDGRRHRRRRRRDLPQLALPPAGARLVRGRDRPAVPAARRRDHPERRGRLAPAAARRPARR